ncbi:MAG: slipin family protein [Leptospiraceae bacterium]|nr:slipin family protein [Leptospiraceae bacterium]
MNIDIKDNEIGLVFKNGKYKKIVMGGRHILPEFFGYSVEIVNLNLRYSNPFPISILLKDPKFKSIIIEVEANEKELILHKEDGVLKEALRTGKYYFFNSIVKHEFEKIDISDYEINSDIPEHVLSNPIIKPFYSEHFIYEYNYGILFVNGKFIKTLKPGRYRFWNQLNTVVVTYLDKRLQQVEIQGQELLTEDRITLRLNFTCQYQIVNPEKISLEIANYLEQIHVLMQLALREFVSTWKLDSLLEKKEEAANVIMKKLKEKEEILGVKFHNAGIKDIILPGEMKDILNTVTIAEKKAQANIIYRREETASTRSLLNTAKILDENPTLLRLKELEYLEKIIEKIDSVNLSTNSGILDQLTGLVKSK